MTRRCSLWAATALAAAAGLVALAAQADAHHSQAPFYDLSRTVEIQGTVLQWEFRNPHPILHLEVADPAGQKNVWLLSFHNTTAMRRLGVTADTFKAGMVVKAAGPPSRVPGTYGLNADLVFLPAGREIKAGAGGGTIEIPK
jgi:DNA/RNA endonuclease YhcR with UshA esterase domain